MHAFQSKSSPTVARIVLSRYSTATNGIPMSNVIALPVTRIGDEELQVRAWEALMAGGYGCAEHNALDRELRQRMSGRDEARFMTH